VNENGGVNGRKLKLIAYDDSYQPSKTVPAVKRLVEEDKVFALVGTVCTPCNAAVKPYLVEKGIPVVAVSSGADQFVNPPLKNYFGYLMNYRVEAAIYVDYAVKKLGAKKVAIAYQNDDFGKEGLEGAKEAIKKYNGLQLVAEVPFLVTDADFSSQAQQLQQSKPDVILAFATPKPAASLRKEMHKINATNIPMIVCAVGANDTNLFKLAGEEIWEGVISSASIPMADDSDDPDMKLYKERFTKDFPNSTYNGNAQWGWAAAQIFVEGLKRAGDDLTWENYIKALETLDNWDGSLFSSVTYTPENRYGVTTLFMTEAKDGKIVPITGYIHYDPATGKITYEE
jgi:ABC-type branched-subunit amino acid transport system substrate-binding protein